MKELTLALDVIKSIYKLPHDYCVDRKYQFLRLCKVLGIFEKKNLVSLAFSTFPKKVEVQ